MNNVTHLEHRASSSLGKHEGESSLGLCDRLDRTRDNSQRQLPTDHDYAVPTREYQTDQSSPFLPWLLLALSSGKQRQLHLRLRRLTRSLHIRPSHSLTYSDRSVSAASRRVTGKCPRCRLFGHVSSVPLSVSDLAISHLCERTGTQPKAESVALSAETAGLSGRP